MISIRIQEVRKRLGPNQALDGISTEFRSGHLHGVIGPEGAGKTTLFRTVLGLLRPDQGHVSFLVQGQEVPASEIRASIAYMPQQQSLYPDLSISEHLDFFRDLYQIPDDVYRARRQELLHITRLEAFQERAAGKLSGGMYKKLGLMCALLQSPRIVLLDEPTNGVDPISRREFWELLYRLREQEILVVVATAYMDEAERCGHVHLIESGKLLEEGEPRHILEREQVDNFDALFLKRSSRGGEEL